MSSTVELLFMLLLNLWHGSSTVIVTYQLTRADMAWYRYEKLALPLRHSTDTVCVKNNATICKMCAPHFDKKTRCTLMIFLWNCVGSTGMWNCSAFCQTHHNLANAPHFHGKRRRNPCIAALYKTAHCGTAIKVRHTWWKKSNTHDAMFSSAAAARLFHSI